MAGRLESHISDDKRKLLVEKLENVRGVVGYLRTKEHISAHHVEEFLRAPEQNQVQYLIDHVNRRGEDGFHGLVDALLATEQYELAEALKPGSSNGRHRVLEDPKASGDGNCISSGGGSRVSPSERNEGRHTLEPPTQKAIRENEQFYRVEKELYSGVVPETDGILNGLSITLCDSVPDYYRSDECYPHLSKPKGLALVFNNRRFKKRGLSSTPPLPERLGTDVDCANLEALLKGLGYEVRIKTDLPAKEILDTMARFSFKSEHERCHSAVVAVLSHGTHGHFYGADEEQIKIESFVRYLNGHNCPALKNKPKIFIFQACRGDTYDEGVDGLGSLGDRADGGGADEKNFNNGDTNLARAAALRKLAELDDVDANNIARTPTDADILIAYATTPGYVSWRNQLRGSWFVQAICEIFSRYAHREEILHLFTRVNAKVAENLSGTGHKQIPEPASRLRKKFYLLPGL